MEAIALNPQYKPKITYRVVNPQGEDDDRELDSFSQAVDELRECIEEKFQGAARWAEIKIYSKDGGYSEAYEDFCHEYAEEIAEENGWRIVGSVK